MLFAFYLFIVGRMCQTGNEHQTKTQDNCFHRIINWFCFLKNSCFIIYPSFHSIFNNEHLHGYKDSIKRTYQSLAKMTWKVSKMIITPIQQKQKEAVLKQLEALFLLNNMWIYFRNKFDDRYLIRWLLSRQLKHNIRSILFIRLKHQFSNHHSEIEHTLFCRCNRESLTFRPSDSQTDARRAVLQKLCRVSCAFIRCR